MAAIVAGSVLVLLSRAGEGVSVRQSGFSLSGVLDQPAELMHFDHVATGTDCALVHSEHGEGDYLVPAGALDLANMRDGMYRIMFAAEDGSILSRHLRFRIERLEWDGETVDVGMLMDAVKCYPAKRWQWALIVDGMAPVIANSEARLAAAVPADGLHGNVVLMAAPR